MAAEPKRVLVIHSFGSAAPPFTTHSIAFETELVQKMDTRVDLDEISLDMARYPDSDTQEALVEYLLKRREKWQPDLVVPIGSPAGVFVAQHRDRLFQGTPILYCGLDRRRLPPDALEKNAAFVGESFDLRGFVEDILQVAPETRNITVVLGGSSLERYWADILRQEYQPFVKDVHFTWVNDLSFDQILQQVRHEPPHSFILCVLFLRDGAGVTHNADEALQRMRAVANAPINGIFQHQLGLGIVGGRLYQAEFEGMEAAHVAIRILHGEAASSFPPRIIGPLPPRYDWRELRRWNIDEKHLPPGSVVLFRTPTVWQQNRLWIILGASVCLMEALLIFGLLVNLIRRRRAERSLAESEVRFRIAADGAPVMIWMSGPDKLCTFFNKAWLEFTGRAMSEEAGNGWTEGVHAEDRNQCLRTYENAFAAHEPFVIQCRLRRHDAEFRQVTANGVPRYDRRESFSGYIGACVDVTDLLEKERALHVIEERVTLAAEAARLGVWELETTTNALWVSNEARELFQFGEAPVSYARFQERVHSEDRAMHQTAVQRAIDSRGGYEIEYRLLLPNGTMRWIASRGRLLSDEPGKPPRLLGVSVDITERKQAQQLFQLATEASPSGTLLVDAEGRVVLVNSRVEKLFGYRREELIGKPFENLVPEAMGPQHPNYGPDFLSAPHARDSEAVRELFARRKDGAQYPVEVGLNPIQTPQGILVLATVVDISARKAAEEEAHLRREQINLLSRVSLLGEMTASLAHELGQPLSAILSNASAGIRFIDSKNGDSGTVREILVDVVAATRRARDIIGDVRNAIKRGDTIQDRVNLNDVVTTLTHIVQPDAAANFCEVQTTLAENLPAIRGNPNQIQQVLINLVSNAFDAMSETPPTRRQVEIKTEYHGDGKVHVGVRDYGCGIPDEARERIFEQFFTTKEQGLGMGLSIVRSIIEAHKGSIEVENAEGGGARFRFHFPVSTDGCLQRPPSVSSKS